MKEKILEILEQCRYEDSTENGLDILPLIMDSDFERVADEIVKLFDIPVVRLSCFKEAFEKFQEIQEESEFYGWLHSKAHEA